MFDTVSSLEAYLRTANDAYRAGAPIIPDNLFDCFEEQLRQADPDNSFLKELADDRAVTGDAQAMSADAIAERTELPRSQAKAISMASLYGNADAADVAAFNREEKLTLAMGSQQKALSLEDPGLGKFYRETAEEEHSWSHKVDGASAEFTYVHGKLIRALTRGDGETGVNFTAVARRIPDLPKTVDHMGTVIVRGEVYLPKSEFAALNADLIAAGKDPISNTRNGAVGLMKTLKNLDYTHHLRVLAFNLQIVD